jgi:hypothetical protein
MDNSWSSLEIAETVTDYFIMLSMEIKGISYRKSDHRRRLQIKLNHRSEGAIEFKHQNISAILIKYRKPYISGYKPRSNYQLILEDIVLQYLESNSSIIDDFEYFTQETKKMSPAVIDFNKWKTDFVAPLTFEEPEPIYNQNFVNIDYLAREQANKRLGNLGEELVISYEKWRLEKEGSPGLVKYVVWVSKDIGDGAGYDILSKNRDGSDRYIEVKTTKLGKLTPIYVTKNELQYSQINSNNYHLYRVFEYGSRVRFFDLKGSLDKVCMLEAISFIGRFK